MSEKELLHKDGKEAFAREMRERGLATGHGDSLEDLHRELWWQVDELLASLKRVLQWCETEDPDFEVDADAIRKVLFATTNPRRRRNEP